jgi:hypothetical protein
VQAVVAQRPELDVLRNDAVSDPTRGPHVALG